MMRVIPPVGRVLLVTGGIAVLLVVTAANSNAELAVQTSAPGCAQFQALKRVFPKATAVGLTSRTAVRREAPTDPLLPGYCATWFAKYRAKAGLLGVMSEEASADTSLTLYRTHKQALRAFEQTSGPVKRLANGALVRTSSKATGSSHTVRVVSVYRNAFIKSLSKADVTPILVDSQLRIHRRMHAGVRSITR